MLGIVGLFYSVGMDAAPYLITPLAGLFLMLTLIVGPLRRLGRYTLGDVITHRLEAPRMRIVIGLCTIVISLINLVAQLVGAGLLIAIVFGIPYQLRGGDCRHPDDHLRAFGGMLAATWVQIIKAVILICMIAVLAALCIARAGVMRRCSISPR